MAEVTPRAGTYTHNGHAIGMHIRPNGRIEVEISADQAECECYHTFICDVWMQGFIDAQEWIDRHHPAAKTEPAFLITALKARIAELEAENAELKAAYKVDGAYTERLEAENTALKARIAELELEAITDPEAEPIMTRGEYEDMRDQMLADGYESSIRPADDEIGSKPCVTCGKPCKSEGLIKDTSYRCFSLCDACNAVIEF